jgi:hypothetical protein
MMVEISAAWVKAVRLHEFDDLKGALCTRHVGEHERNLIDLVACASLWMRKEVVAQDGENGSGFGICMVGRPRGVTAGR